MKLLNLLSRIFKSTKNFLQDPDLAQTPIVLLSIIAVAVGCHFNASTLSENPTDSSSQWSIAPKANKPKSTTLNLTDASGKNFELAQVTKARNCDAPAGSEAGMQTWQVSFTSPFAAHKVSFEFSNDPNNKGVTAEIDQRKILINSQDSIAQTLSAASCKAFTDGTPNLATQDQQVEGILKRWLAMLAPDCKIESNNGQFACELERVEARSAEEALLETRLTMVRSWSRQPYILTRRVSLAVSLAQALQSADADKQLNQLCRIIAHADSMEMPLAMANRRWQDSVCFDKVTDRRAAANIGLQKAVGEIEFLRQLFERTSKLGTLTISIPREISPSKDLWINLTPGPDVESSLASESQSLGAKMSASVDGDFDSPKACWHPLFSVDQNSMQIARYLDLTGETKGISCLEQSDVQTASTSSTPTPTGASSMTPSAYLADSITSETEFVITNGHSKMLRLPAGSYSYEIRGHFEALGWEPGSEDAKTKGQITWSNKRPSVFIKTW